MNWKDLYSQAFPQKQSYQPYAWPKLEKPGPGDASQYPQVKGPAAGPGGAYPQLKGPGPWAAGNYPELKKSGPGEGSKYADLPGQKAWPGSQLPSTHPTDHWGDFNFRVEIEGVECGAFSKVDGLNVSVETIEYQHSDDITPRKRMGKVKVENVKLTKGYINTPALYEWCEEAMKGDASRKSMSIVLLADDGSTEVTRYNCYECWPCKWTGFRMDGQGRGALVEEIEIVVEQVERG